MLRRFFACQKHRVSAPRPFVRLHLEQLEKREVPDASLIPALTPLALNAYQAAEQMQHIQTAIQTELKQFYSDSASYSSGKGATYAQVTQDVVSLQQNANNIQQLNSTLQTDSQLFAMGLMFQMGGSPSDVSPLLVAEADLLSQGQSLANSALQTAAEASSATSATAVPTAPTGQQVSTITVSPFSLNLSGASLQISGLQINIIAQQGVDSLKSAVLNLINSEVSSLKQDLNLWLEELKQMLQGFSTSI